MAEASSTWPAKAVISVPSLFIVKSAGPEAEFDDSGGSAETNRILPSERIVGSVMLRELKVNCRGWPPGG